MRDTQRSVRQSKRRRPGKQSKWSKGTRCARQDLAPEANPSEETAPEHDALKEVTAEGELSEESALAEVEHEPTLEEGGGI